MSKNQPSSSTSGSEPPCDVGAHRLEAALRVARTRARNPHGSAGCSRARAPPASAAGGRGRCGRAGCRSRPRCGRRGSARRAAGSSPGWSRGRRPCTRRRSRRSRAMRSSARGRGPCARAGGRRPRRARRASSAPIAGVPSVLALSAITMRYRHGNSAPRYASSASTFAHERPLLVEDGDDDVHELFPGVHAPSLIAALRRA